MGDICLPSVLDCLLQFVGDFCLLSMLELSLVVEVCFTLHSRLSTTGVVVGMRTASYMVPIIDWFSGGGTVWEGSGGVALLEGISQGLRLWSWWFIPGIEK